jgi:hypothetical protein
MKATNVVLAVGLLAFAGLGSAMAQGTEGGAIKKFHLRFGTPLLASSGSALSDDLTSWGFGDDRTVWALFLPFTTSHPHVSNRPRFDLQVEYSITRTISLGLVVSSLANASGAGYDLLKGPAEGVNSTGNNLDASVRGTAYFLSASYTPPPGPGRRFSPRVGLGMGMSDIKVVIETNIERKVLEGKPLCGLVFAGLDYWPFRSLSIGVTLQYRYVPFRPGAIEISAEYMDYYLDEMLVATYQIPVSNYGLDRLAFGISVGLHF